jgi:hypothetical protein
MNEQLNDRMREHANQLLIGLIGRDNLNAWWKGANKAFDYKSPEEVWKTEPEKIIRLLRLQYNGDYL